MRLSQIVITSPGSPPPWGGAMEPPSGAGRLSDRRKRPTARRNNPHSGRLRSHPSFFRREGPGRLLLPGAAGAPYPTATPREGFARINQESVFWN